jgi:hypothetical protein
MSEIERSSSASARSFSLPPMFSVLFVEEDMVDVDEVVMLTSRLWPLLEVVERRVYQVKEKE